MTYALLALLFVALGTAYVLGYDFVKRRSPGHLVQFYLLMSVVRMFAVVVAVAMCVLLVESREQTVRYVVAIMLMYAVTMATTLTLRH